MRKSSRVSIPSCTISPDQIAPIKEYADIIGTTVDDCVHHALSEWIECDLPLLIEFALENKKKKTRRA